MWNFVKENPENSKMFYDVEEVMSCLMQQIRFNDKISRFGYNHIGDGNSFMQFTGLKDMNGIEIYEGDVLKAKRWAENWTVQFDSKKARFNCILNRDGSHNDFIPANEVEVIGNIYEGWKPKAPKQ